MAETLGEAVLVLRTDDRGLDTGVTNAKAKSEGLGRTLDDTAGKAVNLGKAMDTAGASATRFGEVQARQTAMTGAQRAGIIQLQQNVNDMATMWSLGAQPMMIFTSQFGQLQQAIQLASGGTSKFAALMGSPWTMAIGTAAVVLVPLIGNLLDTEDAAEKAGDANETFTEKLDRNRHSLAEVTKAIREYNAEQKKATETTLDNAAAAAKATAASIREALAIREKLKASIESYAAQVRAGPTGPGGQGQVGAAAGLSYLTDVQAKNDAELARLAKDAAESAADLADELAQIDADPTKKTREGFAQLRKEARETIKDFNQLSARLAELYRQEDAAVKRQRESAKPRAATSSRDASVGDMVALIQSLFPGARITSTTGGKHAKGSDHYAGRAIDFVPGGGMGQYSTAEVERILEEAGVSIRRNAGGTKQLFGPGRSASKPGDHDDHFHVAWSGGASPEEAERKRIQAQERRQRAEEREAQRVERYTRDLAGLEDASAELRARMADTAEERFKLERQGLDIAIAEQRRRIEQNRDYTDAEKAKLLAALEVKASLERELLDRRKREELARQELEVAQAMRADQRDLLQIDLRLAETREERRDIELRLLDLTYAQERAALEAVRDSETASAAQKKIAEARLAVLGKLKGGDRASIEREYESPLERYRREVAGVGNNINDEMEKVAVSGLERLNDGLTDVIMNARSLGDVFKDVAKQIIAELIKIAVQQAIILPLLNAFGIGGGEAGGGGGFLGGLFGGFVAQVPKPKVGGGLGAGTIYGLPKGPFAGMFADGGLIPNGSFGIVGERGPEPIFATAGGIGVLPNSALRGMGGGTTRVEIVDTTGLFVTRVEEISGRNVQQGIGAYDGVVGDRVQEHLWRRG